METNAAEATSNRMYEDFEPYCKWLTEEGQETLEIDLKGFKKEQLKAQTDNRGILTIYGERLLDASGHKWSRFHKEVRLSKDCNANGISAKFSHGILSIVMPKMVQPMIKAAEKKNTNEAGVEATQHAKDAAMEKNSICGVKIRKKTAIKVAIGVVVLVIMVVAFGTHVARLVNRHRHDDAGKVDVVSV